MDPRRDSEGLPPLTSIDGHGSAASMDEDKRGGRPGPHAPDAKCSSRSQHKDKQLQQHLHPFPAHGKAAAAADASMKKRRMTPSSSSNNSRMWTAKCCRILVCDDDTGRIIGKVVSSIASIEVGSSDHIKLSGRGQLLLGTLYLNLHTTLL